MARVAHRFRLALILLVGLALVLAALAVWLLRASLPQLSGTEALAGLESGVEVSRDALGVVSLRGADRADLAQAMGYVHAQDRFFQMDLARRQAAGELSALFGVVALPSDRRNRLHRFRDRAEQVLNQGSDDDRVLLNAYARGVNQGLDALGARPFEYLVLGARPRRWLPEDSLLAAYSMFLTLNDSRGDRDAAMALVHQQLPQALIEFILPRGTSWDAPIQGESYRVRPIPGPEVIDLRERPPLQPAALTLAPVPVPLYGSNNWAVSGAASASGAAMVANDMHLPLRVPNTFYRIRLELQTGGSVLAVTGVTIPGIPVVIAGSNGHVAWGFTNSYGDWTDLVLVEMDPGDPGRYLFDGQTEALRCFDEEILVKGDDPAVETVCETRWGPLLEPDHLGQQRALKWLAHETEALNMGLLRMERASSVAEAIEIAKRAGNPPQNMVVADRHGSIGWTVVGRIPQRRGYDPALPSFWNTADTGWTGWLDFDQYPQIIDPPAGRIWTANARVVDGELLARVGDGGYALGARAAQIREDLLSRPLLGIDDMLAIQLDDRALFYQRWRDLMLETLDGDALAEDPGREEFRLLLADWLPRADTTSVGFRLVYDTRERILRSLFESLTRDLRQIEPDFGFDEGMRYGLARQFEGPAWALLEQRPEHLLDATYASWRALILASMDATRQALGSEGDLSAQTWGERNRASIRHPLSGALWPFSRWLDMPVQALPGATQMPRVQTPDFGASERFAVSPGREDEAYFHMPAGQSGHPLSPFYRAGHQAWVEGLATPFLPGPTEFRLLLSPQD
ncbi:MAG: penicillin acylase family protein [Gammaproteobacteria bacterium]